MRLDVPNDPPIEVSKPETDRARNLWFWVSEHEGRDVQFCNQRTTLTPHWCHYHKRAASEPCPIPHTQRKIETMTKANGKDEHKDEVQVDMTEAEFRESAERLATAEFELQAVDRDRRRAADKYSKRLKEIRANIQKLAEEVDTGKRWVSAQSQLFGEAAKTSAKAAKKKATKKKAASKRAGA